MVGDPGNDDTKLNSNFFSESIRFLHWLTPYDVPLAISLDNALSRMCEKLLSKPMYTKLPDTHMHLGVTK